MTVKIFEHFISLLIRLVRVKVFYLFPEYSIKILFNKWIASTASLARMLCATLNLRSFFGLCSPKATFFSSVEKKFAKMPHLLTFPMNCPWFSPSFGEDRSLYSKIDKILSCFHINLEKCNHQNNMVFFKSFCLFEILP